MLDTSLVRELESAVAPAGSDDVLFDAYSQTVSAVADKVGPAVVRVDTRAGGQTGARQRGGTGSGVFISPDGLVLTNAHVVNGAKELRLSDVEGHVTEARLLGIDPDTDLALL